MDISSESSQLSLLEPGSACPFLKWAGGKRQLLGALHPCVPSEVGRYFEPFAGGSALFFSLQPTNALLCDSNERLMRTYRAVRDNTEEVIDLLRTFPNCKEFFLAQRELEIDARSDVEVAAWFIYLNRTAFNGLYRVNRKGKFNVPFGKYRNPRICDAANLRACAEVLGRTELVVGDFEEAVAGAGEGDFVYFDPPYVPLGGYSDFARYTSKVFGQVDHERLRNVALELKSRGVEILISNSDTDFVRDLYTSGFSVRTVMAARYVNSQGGGRGKISELLIS